MVAFFSQISSHLPTFQSFEAIFSKPRIDMDTIFSIKVAQDPRLHFRKKIKKISFMVLFWFRKLYKHFIAYILA